MNTLRTKRRLPLNALAAALGVWVCSGATAKADGDALPYPPPMPAQAQAKIAPPKGVKRSWIDHRHNPESVGTLGYGPPGVFPGFQGFGLGYHLGYGYGGDGLGTSADGGYPFYGGPGYPRCDPVLRRIGGITPFPYFGGAGGPDPAHPNYYGAIGGGLATDKPVVEIGDDRYDTGYGPQTGAIPYPESFLAPFTSQAASGIAPGGGSSENAAPPAMNGASGMVTATGPTASDLTLGLESEAVSGTGIAGAIRISKVYPGGVADKAGLRPGDLILSVNGYLTEGPGNLSWIVAQKAPDKLLNVNVRSVTDGMARNITARLP